MKSRLFYRSTWTIPTLFTILSILISAGCAGNTNEPTSAPSEVPETQATPVVIENTPTPAPVADTTLLYHDDFTNPATGWPEEKFDNYFIGYHEPEYYHVEISSANYKTTVFAPEKQNFGDATIEVKVLTVSAKTAETGDFGYGPVFRRSGDQYYAFTISPRTKKWQVLKSSSNALVVLAEGTEPSIHELDAADALRVDVQGPNFTFHINDQVVGQVSDTDYAAGEIGFYVQTFDSTNAHIHFDELAIRDFEGPDLSESGAVALYHDDFTNPATGWPEEKFDNYFIGYHEPEYYHVEISSPNYKTTVFEPDKQSRSDVTIEVKVLTVSAKTSETGDFNYGPVFRRSGDEFYAFTISPRTKHWQVLKSSPNALVVLAEGTEPGIHDLDTDDVLRIDAQGPNFTFHINDQLVGEATDADYAAGEIGFYVQTFDSANTHIHFDELTISNFDESQVAATQPKAIYQDYFTNPATGWAEKKFDNYFIGYHEPEYYHIEITSPNYKTTVFAPEKQIFSDLTLEAQVLTVSTKTSETGDFSYGLAFRRSGDQYYAFTISPRTKKWQVLKSSPTALTVLTEGTEQSIHDLDAEDIIRVDANGSNFSFEINGRLVGQATDVDYPSGEVGLYVQTFDSANTHIHFDELAIREFEPDLLCTVEALALNVRGGPGTEFASFTFLSSGDTVQPLARSTNGEWIKIALEGTENQGWVFNSDEFVTCNATVDLLPVGNE